MTISAWTQGFSAQSCFYWSSRRVFVLLIIAEKTFVNMPYTVVIGRSPKQLFTVHQMSTAHGLLCSVDKQLQLKKPEPNLFA